MDWIDEMLGRITMYRMVLYGLVGLVLASTVLMFTGSLGFSPLWFLASTTVLVVVSYASNRLFAFLFGVRPHSESALITGLILAFLFLPGVTVLALVKLALIATIAMASKYILAWRDRHIFNPAAIAVVIASIGGLGYAGWWVATPLLIPLTVVIAGLVLYRTKKVTMAVVFLVVAVVALAIRGVDPLTALTSWPVIFLAGIMLSEPMTLPPRAKQQYIEAAIVGVLIAVPFHYGIITMTPALALIIGNVFGWYFSQRQTMKLRYVGKKKLGGTVYDFAFDTKPLRYDPGQYIELTLVHAHADIRGHRRIFSLASKPGEDQVSIGTKIPTAMSSFKRALMNLKPGTTVYATRIAGDFILPKDRTVPIVCIAGGIGVTPFISFIETADRPLRLIYSLSSIEELSYVETLRQHDVDVTIVAPDVATLPDSDWKQKKGRLDEKLLKELLGDDRESSVYVSGSPAMVINTKRALKRLGITNIKVDEFSGY